MIKEIKNTIWVIVTGIVIILIIFVGLLEGNNKGKKYAQAQNEYKGIEEYLRDAKVYQLVQKDGSRLIDTIKVEDGVAGYELKKGKDEGAGKYIMKIRSIDGDETEYKLGYSIVSKDDGLEVMPQLRFKIVGSESENNKITKEKLRVINLKSGEIEGEYKGVSVKDAEYSVTEEEMDAINKDLEKAYGKRYDEILGVK